MLNQNFVLVGVVISLIGNTGYAIGTLQGKIKPNKVSFFLWSLIPLIAFVAEIVEGVGIQSLTTLMAALESLTIFVASFINKESYWKITKFDLVCGILSLMGILLWAYTRVGNIAIIFALLADALASIPTVVKAYKFPQTENPFPWLASTLAGLLTLLTITTWNLANYGFPLSIFITTLLIFVLVEFKLKRFKLL